MIDTHLRPYFQPIVITPAARWLSKQKISPLALTLLGLFLGISTAPALHYGYPLIAVFLLLLSGFCDALDGTLSRLQNSCSNFGALCDIFSDRTVEFAVVVGLCLVDPTTRALPCLMMLGSILLCITTFLTVGIFTQNSGEKSFHYSCGIMERSEAFGFFIAMILLPNLFLPLSLLFSYLVSYTACYRIWEFSRCDNKTEQKR